MRAKTEEIEWPTLLLLVATYAIWGLGTLAWGHSAVLSLIVTGVAITQFSSLQHEALHGHPFRNGLLNEALVLPALMIFVPYRRFRETHLQHHYDPALTDPYDDPESNFFVPQIWAQLSRPVQILLTLNNTLLGRILLGPLIGTYAFVFKDVVLMLRGDRQVRLAWMLNVIGLVPVLIWVHWAGMPFAAYLGAVYIGLGLLKIRTFLEHRPHDAFRARTVVIEDRGPLALLFLNNNFHAVHHMHPLVAWYKLPGLYADRKAHYLRRNEGYVFANYAEIFRRYLIRAKDPVPHPVWPVRREGRDRGST